MDKNLLQRAIALILLGFGVSQILAALLGFFFQAFTGAWKGALEIILLIATYGGLLFGLWLWDRYQHSR